MHNLGISLLSEVLLLSGRLERTQHRVLQCLRFKKKLISACRAPGSPIAMTELQLISMFLLAE